MSLKAVMKQYEKCQECAYVDDCPEREDKIMAAFRSIGSDVTCEPNNEKEINSNEE